MLRKSGFVIDAVPSRGYRLLTTPDRIDSAGLAPHLVTARIARRLLWLEETGSTNADAFRLAEDGASEGTVVVADSQSGGRGRRGRTWSSPAGVNFYGSIVLRPPVLPHEAPRLTFLSAVAVARAIRLVCGIEAAIKWPNDILVNGRKVAGLLNEMSAETDRVTFIILGIGVNLNMREPQFPDDLRHPATSLKLATGRDIDRSAFAAALFNELEQLYDQFLREGFGPVREEWQRLCNLAGRRIVVSDGGLDLLHGEFLGVDHDGALLARRDRDGGIERIFSGDVRVE